MYLQILNWLWRTSWQASLLVGVVLLAQWLFRRQLTPQWRHGLWLLVVVRFMLPTSFESRVSFFNFFQPATPPITPVAQAAPPVEIQPQAPGEAIWQQPQPKIDLVGGDQGTPEMPPTVTPQPARTSQWNWRLLLLLIWLGGAAVLVASATRSAWRFARRVRHSQNVTDQAVLALLEECRALMGTRRSVTLLLTEAVSVPALYGLWRPRLLLPAHLLRSLDQDQLRFVFLHELGHVKRWDIALNWLLTLLQIVHWFNPLTWLAFSRMRADREMACDALVLQRTGAQQRKAYGLTVLRLLESVMAPTRAPGLVGVLEDKRLLERRIRMIANFDPKAWYGLFSVALAILLGSVCLTDARGVRPLSSPQASPPVPAPVSLVYAPNEPGDGCYTDKPVFWITNHTGKTLNVRIKAIEIRQGAAWVPFSPPTIFPLVGQLHYRKQQHGTPKNTGLLDPHQVDYCHVTTHRIVLPTNAVWRVKASVSELLVGAEKMAAAAKNAPALLAIRLRTGDPEISVNPKDISYWGPAVDVYSREVVPPAVAQQSPENSDGVKSSGRATRERAEGPKPRRFFLKSQGRTIAELRIAPGTECEFESLNASGLVMYNHTTGMVVASNGACIKVISGTDSITVAADEIEEGLNAATKVTAPEEYGEVRPKSPTPGIVHNPRLIQHFSSSTDPKTFRLKSHGKTIAEMTSIDLKDVSLELSGSNGTMDSTAKVVNVRGAAQLQLQVQGGNAIKITAEEIEGNLSVSQTGSRK